MLSKETIDQVKAVLEDILAETSEDFRSKATALCKKLELVGAITYYNIITQTGKNGVEGIIKLGPTESAGEVTFSISAAGEVEIK